MVLCRCGLAQSAARQYAGKAELTCRDKHEAAMPFAGSGEPHLNSSILFHCETGWEMVTGAPNSVQPVLPLQLGAVLWQRLAGVWLLHGEGAYSLLWVLTEGT